MNWFDPSRPLSEIEAAEVYKFFLRLILYIETTGLNELDFLDFNITCQIALSRTGIRLASKVRQQAVWAIQQRMTHYGKVHPDQEAFILSGEGCPW